MKPCNFEAADTLIAGEIPAKRVGRLTLTQWRANWRERLSLLLFGRVWVSTISDHPFPMMLVTSDMSYTAGNVPADVIEAVKANDPTD